MTKWCERQPPRWTPNFDQAVYFSAGWFAGWCRLLAGWFRFVCGLFSVGLRVGLLVGVLVGSVGLLVGFS